MQFTKSDLKGTHYSWPIEHDTTIFNGDPSRRTFDKYNGEQVLFVINFYGSMLESFTIEDGRRIEEEINSHLPLEVKSEISVYNWIKDNCFSEKPV